MAFKKGTEVYHGNYGWGKVITESGASQITIVEFTKYGKKTVEEALLSTKVYNIGLTTKDVAVNEGWKPFYGRLGKFTNDLPKGTFIIGILENESHGIFTEKTTGSWFSDFIPLKDQESAIVLQILNRK